MKVAWKYVKACTLILPAIIVFVIATSYFIFSGNNYKAAADFEPIETVYLI